MKHFLLILLCSCCFAGELSSQVTPPPEKKPDQVAFTENGGQFCDQYLNPRPDVLFGGRNGKMVFHIRRNGVSYQLNNIDSRPGKGPEAKSPAAGKLQTYRVDATWLNANTRAGIVTEQTLPGYSNYYLANCPEGVHRVKTHEGIVLKQIYPAIDLHYYGKNGTLKYDFIVSPYADYRQIQIRIDGAQIRRSPNGSLLLSTPMGIIEEGAPVAYQNGKRVPAEWIIKGHTLSFRIASYDPAAELVIDPPTRVWGSYYGNSYDKGLDCVTDKFGDVYFSGSTSAVTSSIIATVGAHQTVIGGVNSGEDAFLAKFTPGGVRIWATYYGGVDVEAAEACAVDTFANVFICGTTRFISTSGIASPGAHQTVFGGGIRDAFIVKFNSAGVRQWGTYYGGNDDDYGRDCSTDKAGNVYMCGSAESTNTISLATAGAHQSAFGGAEDGFLVKFDPNGVRQWGTYYGGPYRDVGYSCATDTAGQVYLSGAANSVSGIATAGALQTSPPPLGNSLGYLAKFDAAGQRLWGTYYGGAQDECYSVASSRFGYIYVSGSAGNTPALLTTAGCYQPVHGGGGRDGFLAKFRLDGTRVWGTFYGGSGGEIGTACAADNFGNVFLCGRTNSGNNMSTPGAHQVSISAGLVDGFLAKFDSLGMREWSTYYGETCDDYASACTSDNNSHVYMTGTTGYRVGSTIPYTGTDFGTPGSHQPVFGGALVQFTNAYFVKFFDCQGFNLAVGSTSLTCPNVPSGVATVTVTGSAGFTYSWTPSGLNTATATGLSGGTYTAAVTNSCGIVRTKTVQVSAPPQFTINIAASNSLICPDITTSLSVNGGGGTGTKTYSWLAGPAGTLSVVNPTTSTIYTVQITDASTCSQTKTIQISTRPLPVITLSSGTVCAGGSFSLNAGGAQTFTYLNGTAVVSPTITTTYSVVGTGTNGCVSLSPALTTVTVFANPTLSISGAQSICNGATTTLQATGAGSLVWNNSSISSSISVSPIMNTTYTVVGTDALGCKSTVFQAITVNSLPNIFISGPAALCDGSSITLSASGANTYTWSTAGNGISIVVSPLANTIYTLTGTDANGCMNTAIKPISVNSLPVILAQCSSTLVCSGSQVTFNAQGASFYSWTNGVVNNQPATITTGGVYSVTGTDNNSCSATSALTIVVNPLPSLSLTPSSIICEGEHTGLGASGANLYAWSSGQSVPLITVSPSVTTLYSVTGTDLNGCAATATVSVSVDACTGIGNTTGWDAYQVWPNPTNGVFYISMPAAAPGRRVELLNLLGQIIQSWQAGEQVLSADLRDEARGIYLLRVMDQGTSKFLQHIIKH